MRANQFGHTAEHSYSSIESAATGLLVEVISLVSSTNMEFAVCGGWSTVLRNAKDGQHPGTRDVDLLFSEASEEGALRETIELFLQNGYLVSAKHEFQVLRCISVNEHRLVFNVDLLHPKETAKSPSIFVDHLELPIPYQDYEPDRVRMKSIALPSAAVLFDGFIELEEVTSTGFDGRQKTANVPVITEVGILVTKAKSCNFEKRPRDLFDIYLAIAQPKNEAVLDEQLSSLQEKDSDTFSSIACIANVLDDGQIPKRSRNYFENAGIRCEDAANAISSFIEEMVRAKLVSGDI